MSLPIKYDPDLTLRAAKMMCREGTGFISKLGEALSIADSKNAKAIITAFPDLYSKYCDIAVEDDEDTGVDNH